MVKRKVERGNKLPPFVPITWEMLNGKAYKQLKPSAAKALPYFLGKVKVNFRDPQRYLTKFDLSYTEAKKRMGVASSTHHRIICDLVEKGFIDPVDRGGLRGCGRSSSLFKLSERWTKYETPDFEKRDWRSFFPKI